jgi:hypothetical protein
MTKFIELPKGATVEVGDVYEHVLIENSRVSFAAIITRVTPKFFYFDVNGEERKERRANGTGITAFGAYRTMRPSDFIEAIIETKPSFNSMTAEELWDDYCQNFTSCEEMANHYEVDLRELKQVIREYYNATIRDAKKEVKPTKKDDGTSLTWELYESPMKERNEDKYGYMQENQCICCFKPMKKGEILWVHMNTNWKAVDNTKVTEENCERLTKADSQGCFPIGNSCAAKMPKRFTFKDSFEMPVFTEKNGIVSKQ